MGKFSNKIHNSSEMAKVANKAKVEANLKKGMPVDKAVKKAYPKMSKKDIKRTVRLIKKQSITQGPNSTMNVHIHNSPRIQDNRGRRELAIQDNKGRGDFQDSHSRKWAHGSYGEKVATISKSAALWDRLAKRTQNQDKQMRGPAERNPDRPKTPQELERERLLYGPPKKSPEEIEAEKTKKEEERRKRDEEFRLKMEGGENKEKARKRK